MIAMTLAEIASATNGTLHLVDGGLSAESIVSGAVHTDSRDVRSGDIFVAKPGEFTDGHLFAPTAAEQGAALMVVERPLDLPVAQIVVDDAVAALGDFATEVVARVRALGKLKIVGVTGSNGKTTTKNLIRAEIGRAHV